MKTKFIEATDKTNFNWGKFMVMRFTQEEWAHQSALPLPPQWAGLAPEISTQKLLAQLGWSPTNIIVFDLQTGEGAIFRPKGYAKADLDKHQVWVCPMYEPFLEWLYKQDLSDLDALPSFVNLGDVPTAMAGYRRHGPSCGDITCTCPKHT